MTGHLEGGVHFLSPLLSIGVIDTNIADCIDTSSGYMIIPVKMDGGTSFTAPNEGDELMRLAMVRSQITSFTNGAYFQMEIKSP
jgi:hypothetical protein